MTWSKSLATCLLLVSTAVALPSAVINTANLRAADLYNMTVTADRAMLAAYGCGGQSCLVADAAGSTGRAPLMMPEGANDADVQCVAQHNPDVVTLLQTVNNKAPLAPKQNTTFVSTLMIGLNSIWRPIVQITGSTETGVFNATCAPTILIFAKGTFEPFSLGVFIGPSFVSGLDPTQWSTHGVPYTPDVPGDFCLGLPGGMVAKQVIDQAAQKCPRSRLFVSGYSQGAMVIRNGLARASPAARARGVITFDNPFNGAPIKGYNGPIAIFCNSGDGDCTGNFELRPGHLSCGFDTSAGLAQRKLLDIARGGGDSSCCRSVPAFPPPTPSEWLSTLRANNGKIRVPVAGTSVEQWAQAISESHGRLPKYTNTSSPI